MKLFSSLGIVLMLSIFTVGMLAGWLQRDSEPNHHTVYIQKSVEQVPCNDQIAGWRSGYYTISNRSGQKIQMKRKNNEEVYND